MKRIPGLAAAYRSLQTHIRLAECVARATDARAFRARWHAERTFLEGEPAFEAFVRDELPPVLAESKARYSTQARRVMYEALDAMFGGT